MKMTIEESDYTEKLENLKYLHEMYSRMPGILSKFIYFLDRIDRLHNTSSITNFSYETDSDDVNSESSLRNLYRMVLGDKSIPRFSDIYKYVRTEETTIYRRGFSSIVEGTVGESTWETRHFIPNEHFGILDGLVKESTISRPKGDFNDR